MIRVIVETKLILDLSKLAIFIANNSVPEEVKVSTLELLKYKPAYIGTYSALRYINKVQYHSGVLAVVFGQMLLSDDAARYVHLEEMFKISHTIYHDSVAAKVQIVQAIIKDGVVR